MPSEAVSTTCWFGDLNARPLSEERIRLVTRPAGDARPGVTQHKEDVQFLPAVETYEINGRFCEKLFWFGAADSFHSLAAVRPGAWRRAQGRARRAALRPANIDRGSPRGTIAFTGI